MKSLSEYTNATPATELYHFLAEAIVEGKISSFSALLEFTKTLPNDQKTAAVYTRLFKLIRKLYWGFFREVEPSTYPKVWNEIVIPHPQHRACGDLKRNLTISDVYVGILDLHGYTNFCETNKNNLSMLQMLDDIIQNDVVKLAREHNVVLQRRQGDEMVLVGASAVDMITVTLLIIDYFSKKRLINLSDQAEHRSGYKIILQDMHISAGIAGGKKFTPFIITQDGDLSGGVVNTAARLQSRANELSGYKSRILITRTVYTSFSNETKNGTKGLLKDHPVHFFDSGWITFKGITVALNEVIFDQENQYKLSCAKEMGELYRAVENTAWKDGLFINLIVLFIKLFRTMGKFKIIAVSNGLQATLTNEDLIAISADTLERFKSRQDYLVAFEKLDQLIHYCYAIPDFDRLTLEYAERILEQYQKIATTYRERLDSRIETKAPTVLPAKYRQVYEESKKGNGILERLRGEVRKSITPTELAQLWNAVLEEKQSDLAISIHSGKK